MTYYKNKKKIISCDKIIHILFFDMSSKPLYPSFYMHLTLKCIIIIIIVEETKIARLLKCIYPFILFVLKLYRKFEKTKIARIISTTFITSQLGLSVSLGGTAPTSKNS